MREEPRDILAGVYELLRAELKLDCAFQYLVDDERPRLRLNFAAGVSAEQEASLEWLDFGVAVCGDVALHRQEIVRADVQGATDPMVQLVRGLGIGAYACVPLIASERLIGTFSVGTRSRTRFTRDEVDLLRDVAVQLGVALDRRRLIRSLRLLRERGDRLQALTSALSMSTTPRQVATAVIEHTTPMFAAMGTVITRVAYDGAGLEILDARSMPGDLRQRWERFPSDADVPLAEAVRNRETIVIESRAEWAQRYPALAGLLESSGQHAVIVIPLVIEGRAIGSMGLAFDRPRRFTSDDRNLMDVVAQQCAQALERARLFESEQRSRAAAEAANREKVDVLAQVSHDLRTPLNAIGGYVQLLEMGVRGPITEEQRHDLARIAGNQRHLLHLVHELLRFSALTSTQARWKIERILASEALRSAVDSVAPQAVAKSVKISVVCEDEDLAILADAERLQQILMNILANAVKFTPAGADVVLSASAVGAEAVHLRIRDSGPGIPAAQQNAIFEPFRQLEDRPAGSDGVGLGLAISRTLARASGGDVTVESVPGAGATVVVRLPRSLDA